MISLIISRLLLVLDVEAEETGGQEHLKEKVKAIWLLRKAQDCTLLQDCYRSQDPVEQGDDRFWVRVEGDPEVQEGESYAYRLRSDKKEWTCYIWQGTTCFVMAVKSEKEGQSKIKELQGVIGRQIAEDFEAEAVKKGFEVLNFFN